MRQAALIAMLGCYAFGTIARADCMSKAFRADDFPDDPVYELVSCDPARLVVEKLRQDNPAWFGSFTYTADDAVITVAAANEDARRLMWADIEYWYYPAGCSGIPDGTLFVRPRLAELCCDIGPVNTLPCGVGGKTLLETPD